MRKTWKVLGIVMTMFIGYTPASRANPDVPTSMTGEYKAGVAAAHPIAVAAGMEMLSAGGNAIDAAVATAFALGVVEPAASGLGGGGFLLFRSAESGDAVFYDYRETAPAGLTRESFSPGGRPLSSRLARGGLAVGVPGTVRGLLLAHREHGTLPLPQILAPAIRAARDGFPVSALLNGLMQDNLEKLAENEAAARVYLEDEIFPLPVGSILVQEDLAKTLESIAAQGEEAIYAGEMARRIAEAVRETGGSMTPEDLAGFQVVKREPLSGTYRGYTMFTAPPPSSGGIQLLQALSVLEHLDIAAMGPDSAEYIALIITILNQTGADAAQHVADPGHHDVPISELISEEWRARLLELLPVSITAQTANAAIAPVTKDDPGNTTHLSVIDKDGNVVALTQTINSFFGSGVMVPGAGIMLNNELFDFTAVNGSANFPEPGKKPRSSMTPTILVGGDGQLASIGTPGGLRIPGSLLQVLLRRIDHGQTLAEAINAPRLFVDPGRKRVAFEAPHTEDVYTAAVGMLDDPEGWSIQPRSAWDAYFGGAHAVWVENGLMEVSADPRRDGAVAAE